MYISLLLFLSMLLQDKSFKEKQLSESRVKSAYEEKEKFLRESFQNKNLNFDAFEIFIRGFKKEGDLEVWVRDKQKQQYILFTTYKFCATSGSLGPKRKEGDLQIPEGIYSINHFNPQSNFHLSLGINYPNASDKKFSDKDHPGSAIYIHGNCVTIGCIPITDDKIKELYVLAVEARSHGQQKIPVHLFPTKLTNEALQELVLREGTKHETFWRNLQPIFLSFEKEKKLTTVKVNEGGLYALN